MAFYDAPRKPDPVKRDAIEVRPVCPAEVIICAELWAGDARDHAVAVIMEFYPSSGHLECSCDVKLSVDAILVGAAATKTLKCRR